MKGKRQRRCPGRTAPLNLRRLLPRRHKKGGIALGLGLSLKQSTIWGSPHLTSSPPGSGGLHTPGGGGFPALEEVWERTRRGHTVPFSPRRRARCATTGWGGEGIRWARVLADSGGPWASAPPRRRRLLPPLARLRSPLRRLPVAESPRPPPARPSAPPARAPKAWGRSAPQRPVRARRRPGRGGAPALPPASLCSQLPAPPPRLRRLPKASLSRGEGQNLYNWMRFSEPRLPGLLGGRGDSGEEGNYPSTCGQKCVFQCIK